MPTPENERKIQYLTRYQWLDKRIIRLLEEQCRLREKALRITPVMSPLPGGQRGTSSMERFMENVLEIGEEINREIDELRIARRKIWDTLNQLKDENLKLIMEYRYIEGMTWEQIAEKMHYGVQWVCKLHGRALADITLEEAMESDTPPVI